MRVRYPSYIPNDAEARSIRDRLRRYSYLWNGVCVSRTPVEDTRHVWQRIADWFRSL
jgi:hypothetical protein